MFVDIKRTQWADHSLRRRLGLGEDDDHPQLEDLWDLAHERNSNRLFESIVELQGFWVKLGQYLSSRADVVPPQYIRVLSTLQDGVPSKPFADVMATLREEFSEEELALFASIDPESLSTASLAQVHRATLVDGREVVAKVQHRGVASLMRQDMANLKTLLGALATFDKDADFGPVVKEWTSEVLKELDFRQEAVNMAEVKTLLAKCKVRAIVPSSEERLVKERVLVMDYCPGFPIRDQAQMTRLGVDRETLLSRVVGGWAAQMHVAGVFNADPHAGNILVSTSPCADGDRSVPVLLDFGLTKRLSPKLKVAFARLVHASSESDVDGLLQSFNEMGLTLNENAKDPLDDLAGMQRAFSDPVPASKAKAHLKRRAAESKLDQEARREEAQVPKGEKLRSPVDAWPSELIFFTRVTAMLRGLCSSLEVAYPYLDTMAVSARQALVESVPESERAKALLYPHSFNEHSLRGEDPLGGAGGVVGSSSSSSTVALQLRLEEAVTKLLVEGDAIGLQVSVFQHGVPVASVCGGTLGKADPRPVTPSTLFNVFSVSKAVLAAGVMVLVDQGRIHLDDQISTHWPEFQAGANITVRHALCHQAGLAGAQPSDATLDTLCDWEGMKAFVCKAQPDHEPGAEIKYHALSFGWICGGLIEAVTRQPYEAFLEEALFAPLGCSGDVRIGGVDASVASNRLAVLSKRLVRSSPTREKETRSGAENELAARTPLPPPPPVNSDDVLEGKEVEVVKTGKRRLEKYKANEALLNPSIFNMRKVRSAKLPAANGHASARALASLMAALSKPGVVLSREALEAARSPQTTTAQNNQRGGGGGGGVPLPKEGQGSKLLDNAGATFGLGFQLHALVLPDGSQCQSIGHSGLGGSLALAIPELGLSFALTSNLLEAQSTARRVVVECIFEHLGVEAPASLLS